MLETILTITIFGTVLFWFVSHFYFKMITIYKFPFQEIPFIILWLIPIVYLLLNGNAAGAIFSLVIALIIIGWNVACDNGTLASQFEKGRPDYDINEVSQTLAREYWNKNLKNYYGSKFSLFEYNRICGELDEKYEIFYQIGAADKPRCTRDMMELSYQACSFEQFYALVETYLDKKKADIDSILCVIRTQGYIKKQKMTANIKAVTEICNKALEAAKNSALNNEQFREPVIRYLANNGIQISINQDINAELKAFYYEPLLKNKKEELDDARRKTDEIKLELRMRYPEEVAAVEKEQEHEAQMEMYKRQAVEFSQMIEAQKEAIRENQKEKEMKQRENESLAREYASRAQRQARYEHYGKGFITGEAGAVSNEARMKEIEAKLLANK